MNLRLEILIVFIFTQIVSLLNKPLEQAFSLELFSLQNRSKVNFEKKNVTDTLPASSRRQTRDSPRLRRSSCQLSLQGNVFKLKLWYLIC